MSVPCGLHHCQYDRLNIEVKISSQEETTSLKVESDVDGLLGIPIGMDWAIE